MKKAISLLLAIVICLSLCACGKSEAVKNVEALIEAIGEVTLDSEAAIVAAENAYNSLTDEEKAKVENTEVLTAARDNYEFLLKEQAFLGTWRQVLSYPDENGFSITFSENKICSTVFYAGSPQEAAYTFTENGVEAHGITFELVEIAGFPALSAYSGDLVLVREADYEEIYDKVFVTVDLATADISEYADIIHLDYREDDFGEKVPSSTYLIVSKVYEQGLIYMGGWDVIVEYDNGCTVHGGFPFGSTCRVPEFGRMTGTIVFIRSEYVAEIELTHEERSITTVFQTGSYTGGYFSYLDYPY